MDFNSTENNAEGATMVGKYLDAQQTGSSYSKWENKRQKRRVNMEMPEPLRHLNKRFERQNEHRLYSGESPVDFHEN